MTTVAVLAGLLLAAQFAPAQTLGEAEEQRRRARQDAAERTERQQAPGVRLPGPETPPDADATDLPDEMPCFPIRRVRIDGNRPDAFPWIQPHLDRYADRCVGRRGLDIIVKRLSARLLGEGFITTRVGIPEQNFSGGTLRLVLVPGIVRSIRIVGATADVSWESAFPMGPGDLLNLRDIEQGLEQLKRVPSQDADLDIAPGASPGESDIVVKLKRGRPWRLSTAVDDSGSKATGRRQGSIGLAVDNPFGLNDLFSLSFNNDAESEAHLHATRGNSLSYSLPWGYWTFAVARSTYRYHQLVKGTNQSFISSGTSASQEVSATRTVHRDRASKTSVQLRLTHRLSRSYVENLELIVQRRGTAAAELGLQHRHYLGTAQVDIAVARKEGIPHFGGQGDTPDRAVGAPTNRYRLYTIDAAVSDQFKVGSQPLRLTSALRGQATSDRLYAADQISIGNRATVRGVDGETTLAAERGWYLRNELDVPLGASGQSIYLGLDHGDVAGPSAAAAGRRLTGAAIGFRSSAVGLSYDIFAAWAIHKPGGFPSIQPATGFRLSYQF
ncbi:MAG: ShlB/FhaC/HecB family hemolysin secretion/activation protein [Sterolibacteriaceae bacterium MAG5]|nr:ShlB/FhaC/HecB family hemolysin secretion/activation protein [Candidatus Nitricoxidireducens bremensis]